MTTAVTFDIVAAAREANRVYLSGCNIQGTARKMQEYDHLTETGKLVWHAVVRCSMHAGSH